MRDGIGMGTAVGYVLVFAAGTLVGGLVAWLRWGPTAPAGPLPITATPVADTPSSSPAVAAAGEQAELPLATDDLKQAIDASRGLMEDLERRYGSSTGDQAPPPDDATPRPARRRRSGPAPKR